MWSTAKAQEFTPSGTESAVGGPLPGDQVYSAASAGPGGGYLVWQDSKADGRGRGQGIVARPLSGSLQSAGEPFVISQRRAGHQERPSVAVLTNGGAAFAWLGPNHSSPDVFVRFLRPDGMFLTGDVQVNPLASRLLRSTKVVSMPGYKNNQPRRLTFRLGAASRIFRDRNQGASVTALPDGGALVTYAGWRRYATNWQEIVRTETYRSGTYYTNDVMEKRSETKDWMLDVFFQRFGADGKKIGGETLVNQFTKNNQREPSVAMLPNGTFVVVWVSESFVDNFTRNFSVYAGTPLVLAQVDIVARIFAADGTPLSNEFTINTAVRTCATPTVSAMSDGRFTVAWAQRDGTRANGWDIHARAFDVNGYPTGDAVRVNGHTYGDQYAPVFTAAGTRQLLAWSSRGQDEAGPATGNFIQRDGTLVTVSLGRPRSVPAIYGRLFEGGAPVGAEFRVNTSLTGKPMQPTLVSDGVSRMVALWSGLNAEGDFDLFTQAYASPLTIVGNHGPNAAQFANHAVLNQIASPGTPVPPLSPVPGLGNSVAIGSAPRLSVSASVEKLRLDWTVESGARYQIQTSTNLVHWTDVGEARTAAAATDTLSLPLGVGTGFYRVVKLR